MQYGYIYIRTHLSYDCFNACKLGKTVNIPDRDSQYATGEIQRGCFLHVYRVKLQQLSIIERLLQYDFKEYNIRYDGGTEFYNKIIIDKIQDILKKYCINYEQLTDEDISKLIRAERLKQMFKKIDIPNLITMLKTLKKNNIYNWKARDYQQEIIKYSFNELLKNNKIYIELPTGGGKSYIVYNLLKMLKSKFILIVSPRKIINSQNVSAKYLQLLNKPFKVFNYSSDDKNNIEEFLTSDGNKIVICCTKSVKTVYDCIKHIPNMSIWIDEAHWGVEENVKKSSIETEMNYLFANVKYKIFTSASPNKKIISENTNIFGELYSPIKVSELIKLNWLSPIKPYIYSENKNNVNEIKYILSEFNEKHRTFGFSFHNKQTNAFNLFYKHYSEYKDLKTNIKPFLLIGDDFNESKEPKLTQILLDYSYRCVSIFEQTEKSIGYVVNQYSMGYDFNKIDFITITDSKLSISDIIQCIGRGTRPDGLGLDGKNLIKELILLLPVYIDLTDGEISDYSRIIEVLKYLLYNLEIPLDEIEFVQPHAYAPSDGNNCKIYNGLEDIKAVMLDLLNSERLMNLRKDMTYEMAKNIIFEKNIRSKKEYLEYCEIDPRFYKNPDEMYSGKFENWIKYLGIPRMYYDLETCKCKIDEHTANHPDIKKHHLEPFKAVAKLCEIDNNFPSPEFWHEYYEVNNLSEIICLSGKKKKKYLCCL